MSGRACCCVLVPVIALLWGCEPEPLEPIVTQVLVTGSDFSFEAPDTVPAGLVSIGFRDLGPSAHHVVVLEVPDERSATEAIDSITTHGSVPEWLTSRGGPEVTEAPTTNPRFVSKLDPGDYLLICVLLDAEGRPHYEHGMLRPLVVQEAETPKGSEHLVAADTLLMHDFRYDFAGRLEAGPQRIWVHNRGEKRHHAEILRIDSGATFADVVAALADPAAPQPLTSVGGLTGLSPGRSGWLEIDLPAGSYALVCFFFDTEARRQHYELSMIQPFEVEATE